VPVLVGVISIGVAWVVDVSAESDVLLLLILSSDSPPRSPSSLEKEVWAILAAAFGILTAREGGKAPEAMS
jgi:hypothetical protein